MPVRNFAEVAADPQTSECEMFPVIGGYPVTGPPVKFSATASSVRLSAPKLGEHTREILNERLGLDVSELDRLDATGVIKAAS